MVPRLVAKLLSSICVHLIIFLLVFFDPVVASSTVVKYLPGFPGPLPFNLETGYIGVDEKEEVQLFFYFIESEGSPKDDPLILWFTGGRYCSGLSALAFEIGPVQFNMVKYNGSLPTLSLNPNSWTKAASIIFIDTPVGSGFSYSRRGEVSQTSDLEIAHQSFNFLKKWLIAHPKFMSNPLYLAGQSYGGITIALVAEEIAKSIEASHTPKFNFQGYLLGNPLANLDIDWNSNISFAHRMGIISDELYKSVKKTCKGHYRGNYDKKTLCGNDLRAILLCTEKLNHRHILDAKCNAFVSANGKKEFINRKSLLEKPSPDVLEMPSPDFPVFGTRCYGTLLIHSWANDKAVQRALHIRRGTIKTWIRCRYLLNEQQLKNVVSYHQRRISQGYRVLVYSGDHDMSVPYVGTQAWIKSLNIPIVDQWRPWLVDDQIAGYVTEYSKGFTFATVKDGGHTAPEYRPKECFAMFKRWISQEPL